MDAARSEGLELAGLDDQARLLTPLAAMSRYPGFGELDRGSAERALQAAATISLACDEAMKSA